MSKALKSSNSFFDSSRSIFVSGLHSRVTEEVLWELFLQVKVKTRQRKLFCVSNLVQGDIDKK